MLLNNVAILLTAMEIKRESVKQRCGRVAKNVWTQTVGISAKATPTFRILCLERELKDRKRAFGIRYIDLLQNDASNEHLQECVGQAHVDVVEVEQKIIEMKIAIDQIAEKTRTKLVKSPSKHNEMDETLEFGQQIQRPTAEKATLDHRASDQVEAEFVVVASPLAPSAPTEDEAIP